MLHTVSLSTITAILLEIVGTKVEIREGYVSDVFINPYRQGVVQETKWQYIAVMHFQISSKARASICHLHS